MPNKPNLIRILFFITIANLQVIANTPINHRDLTTNEYQTVAFVRTDQNLNHLETRFINKHTKYRTENLARFLNPKTADNITHNSPKNLSELKIALCFSGGGYRSMIYSLGILLGAEKINLLPAVSYLSCLSGSTWSIGAYLSSDHKLCELREHFKIITQNNLAKFYRLDHLFDQYLQHKFLYQSSNLILLWGSLLANQILNHVSQQKFSLRLSEQQYFAEHYTHLLPIYTAITPSLITPENINLKPAQELTNTHPYNYNWLEFTPYEISYITELAAIPSWAFGRQFAAGVSQNFTPELSLAYLLGVFGSAFTANLSELYREPQPLISVPVIDFKQPKLNYLKYLPHVRLLPAKINNFSFGLELEPANLGTRFWSWNQIKTKIDQRLQKIAHHQNIPAQQFTLLDAGIDFNLPLPPLLKPARQIDVIIIADISGSLPEHTELTKALKYAREKFNLIYAPELPKINTNPYTPIIYNCQNQPAAPVILYLPADYPKIPAYKTTNFSYPVENFEQLCNLGEANIIKHVPVIRAVLQKRLKLGSCLIS